MSNCPEQPRQQRNPETLQEKGIRELVWAKREASYWEEQYNQAWALLQEAAAHIRGLDAHRGECNCDNCRAARIFAIRIKLTNYIDESRL